MMGPNEFMRGAIVVACAAIGFFFLRFWRRSGDRLFVYFAITFWVLGVDWFALAWVPRDEPHNALFLLRLLAFVVLLLGIWDKNRRPT
jgi:hypothetical protein